VLNIENISKCIAMYNLNARERNAITTFKSKFVDRWGIFDGASVLEIGCGQGDTTAILAEAVGNNGQVIATDIADANYGSPITIGEAAKFLSESRLGSRIKFLFNFNINNTHNIFTNNVFDFVVFAHCSYYFESREILLNSFINSKKYSKKLCFSEWDIVADNIMQIPHLLAIIIQGQFESFKQQSFANIRSPFSKQEIENLLDKAGWIITEEFKIDSSPMKEYVNWEVDICLDQLLTDSKQTGIPKKFYDNISWQIDALRRYTETYSVEPLPSFSFLANKE